MVDDCYVTAGLLDALLELAADREPESVSTLLAVTPAGALDVALDADPTAATDSTAAEADLTATDADSTAPGADSAAPDADPTVDVGRDGLDPATPVFTDVYVPSEGRSVDAVFGVDVSIPHGQAQGRFVSHPQGELEVSTTDDLHEVVLVAVPPWRRETMAAFDRSGQRLALQVVHAAPPERPFDG